LAFVEPSYPKASKRNLSRFGHLSWKHKLCISGRPNKREQILFNFKRLL